MGINRGGKTMNRDGQLLYTVARLYYLDNLNQAEISAEMGLSRPKVSRLLAKAREDGIVNIQISPPPCGDVHELEERIRARFGLEHVLVTESPYADDKRALADTVRQAAPFFQGFLRDGDKIGIAWGYTLLKLAEHLQEVSMPASVILQIAGNLDNADSNNFANEIVRHFSQKLGVKSLNTLPCPVVVENSIIVDLLLHDSKISHIINQVNGVDVAFPNIGVLSEENCLWRTGYISTEELQQLHRSGSVGCICCRFINERGEIVDPSLDERTISIGLEALRSARPSCACIASDDKVPPLIGSLRAGLVDVLAIDSRTAETLLAYAED
ncbi:sugar-binding transcriptional regulator [Anaerotruncus massiliensis (ex Liu et al. 2021)]|uniref:sugar-binding transcriptional regulator n=1 Tax=Anaerotruncus massiliensis (ex Liu et al. 2021) TaxID=2321404 RepID=UPI003AB58EEA